MTLDPMSRQSSTGWHLKRRLFLAVGFLILLIASLVKGEYVLAASGAIGLAWAFESYRWSKRDGDIHLEKTR
jgi:hypothetical protein